MEISGGGGGADGHYKPLAPLYFGFTLLWAFSAATWTFNTRKNGQFQPNNLQWMLASVPWIKSLHLSSSFLFWYLYLQCDICSLWMSFGVYITGIVFQTSALVSFILVSHGYCITSHRLSLSDRRTTALHACAFYLTLVGYKASVPCFSMLLLLNYILSFSKIFKRVSRNLTLLRDQLSFIEDEDVHTMHDSVHTKFHMFKKFQGAMHVVVVSELAVFLSMDSSAESYWVRLLIREWAQFFVFFYIGWIFRCQELAASRFSLMPTLSSERETAITPIYSIEMDAKSFKEFTSHEWHIGVPTLPRKGSLKGSVVVVIRHPH